MDIPYQCIGCTASGLTRQTDEGKKYSNVAYEHSITQGYVEIRNSPNLKFVIHNSGGKKTNNSLNKSVLIELSKKSIFTESNIKKIEKEINDARKTFIKYKWPTIDVTRKSVEETAASIIKIYEINKNNG